DDCSTQRNLSETGREQARRIGALFRNNGIDAARVYSSQWCRCLETARLLELGPVTEQPIINSFFRAFHREAEQTRQLGEWLAQQELSQPLVLVSHQVNITAFSGVYPSSGELVVLRRGVDGQFTAVGTLETD
ncbi:MAG: histidine phosphatase family protein, partial [Deltaproteobacteria bacterium]|nr:histidine phosphatase family protein [Deltaproteobacteria bacterium]